MPAVLTCNGNADEVLARLRDAFDRILAAQADRWPSDDEWRALLPAWLVDAFAPEGSGEGAAAAQPVPQSTGPGDDSWTLGGWIFRFEPDIRPWFWWHGAVASHETIEMSFEVEGHPTPYGALRFLFRSAGATGALIDGE